MMTEKQEPIPSLPKPESDTSSHGSEGTYYEQNGKHGIGHLSDGKIQAGAKVAGELYEAPNLKLENPTIQNFNVYCSPNSIDGTSQNPQNASMSEPPTAQTEIPTQLQEAKLVEQKEQKGAKEARAKLVLDCELIADDQAQLGKLKITISAIVKHLQNRARGESEFLIIDIEEGSIRITLEGSEQDLQQLQQLFEAGALTEVLGIPVESFQLLEDAADQSSVESTPLENETTNTALDEKARLVQEIRTQRAIGRDLSRANLGHAYLRGAILSLTNLSHANLSHAHLSRANLTGAYLGDANLRGADLSRACLLNANLDYANLSGADLSGAILYRANLSGANLSGANLSGANLTGVNLSGANLSGAKLNDAQVQGARFETNAKLSAEQKIDLIRRGAIFEDTPGDRSGVLVNRT